MNKFTVDSRYNHISILDDSVTLEQIYAIETWCNANGNYKVYATGIVYSTEQDLLAFLLKWSHANSN